MEFSREVQLSRQERPNAFLKVQELREFARLSFTCTQVFQQASQSLNLSLRAQHRMLRVARTIAYLNQNECISERDIAEALTYRAGGALHG